jgi:hypothetical protein
MVAWVGSQIACTKQEPRRLLYSGGVTMPAKKATKAIRSSKSLKQAKKLEATKTLCNGGHHAQ